MMRLLVYIDSCGIEKVELSHTGESEREQAHRLYESLRNELERLDAVAKAVGEAVSDAEHVQ